MLAAMALTAAGIPAQATQQMPCDATGSTANDGFNQYDAQTVAQVDAGWLLFLVTPPKRTVPLFDNQITITEAGSCRLLSATRSMLPALDAVPEADVVYRYQGMHPLRIVATRNIDQ
jgi:hypothetical protein